MKTKLIKRLLPCILALLLIPAFILTLFAGCQPEEEQPDPTMYTVTVVDGTIQGTDDASGSFAEGTSVTVVATVPEGQTFVRWTVGGSEVSTSATYTFTVNSNITLTAEFDAEEPPVTQYTVTVVGGTGGGQFEEGSSCTVVAAAAPSGQVFYGWMANGQTVSTSSSYTFTVSANITLTAIYDDENAIHLNKSVGGNPIGGFGVGDETFDPDWTTASSPWQEGDADYSDVITYGGDPAVMVVEENGVETAYLYVGHDITETKITSTYTMPEWICYSSTDLINWKTESIIMDIEDIPWARGQAADSPEMSAWASQVIEWKGYYWFLFCSWSENTAGYVTAGNGGDMCIGLAVSDSPTGPFECYNEPLVFSSWTDLTETNRKPGNGSEGAGTVDDAGWNDIDPTAWVTSENEMYVAWGNTNSFMCQVEMVESADNGTSYPVELEIVDQSEKANAAGDTLPTTDDPAYYRYDDLNGDVEGIADIIQLDLFTRNTTNNTFTEAPYLYARDLDGDNSVVRYYMFYAAGWREALAYSYVDVDSADGLWTADTWQYGNRLMDPTATSNTNHPAVFDFGGKTYMIYHNGSLPYGCGYRRVACIAELSFSENGFIDFVAENSTGLDGVNSKITQSDIPIGHLYTVNSHDDAYYPINLPTFWKAASSFENEDDALWEIEAAKYVPDGMNADSYVSIQAYNMAGLYLSYDIATGDVVITQDDEKEGTPESDAEQMRMSFKTVAGENGVGVMFQCVANEEYYLAIVNGELVVSNSATAAQRTFRVQTQTANRSENYVYNEGAATIA